MSSPAEGFLERLSEKQQRQLEGYETLLLRFNQKINLISRASEEQVWQEHICHALVLSWRSFPAGSTVVDWGTGGGLPAIPLAIAFPEVRFFAVDTSGKKVQAVRAMTRRLELENLFAWEGQAETWPGEAQYSVSRATAPLAELWRWHERVYAPSEAAPGKDDWLPGLLSLKGGDLREEIAELKSLYPPAHIEKYALEPIFQEASFTEKYIVAVRRAHAS